MDIKDEAIVMLLASNSGKRLGTRSITAMVVNTLRQGRRRRRKKRAHVA
jgi:hypothetical protein